VSASVRFTLKIPLFCPQKSTKICCRLPVLLSLLLSASAKKIRYTGWSVDVVMHEKTRNEIVQNHFLVAGSLSSKKHTLRNETPFFTTLSPTLDTITLTHNAALLSGLCLLTFHVLLMSLNPYELFYR
jgi:hypothetical protein